MLSEVGSRTPIRIGNRGFTILEAMVSFVLLGIFLSLVYSQWSRGIQQQAESKKRYELSAMGDAVLDEYITTYPHMAASGQYMNTWSWKVTETAEAALMATKQDTHFKFVRITVKIRQTGTTDEPFTAFTIVARPAT